VQKKSVNRGAPTGQVQKEGQKLETIIFYSFSYELFFTSHFMNMYFFLIYLWTLSAEKQKSALQ